METTSRSLVKTIVFRVVITLLTAIGFVLIGRDPMQAISESVGINIFYAICYYINERVWNNISWGRIGPR
jgi:uncharacterized membrane protein